MIHANKKIGIVFVLIGVLTACSVSSKAPERLVAGEGPQAKVASEEIRSLFVVSTPATLDSVLELVKSYESSREFLLLSEAYSKETIDHLKVPFKEGVGFDIQTWLEDKTNQKIYSGLMLYVDDPPDGSEQVWKSINRELRAKKKLSKSREAQLRQILFSLNALPSYSGLVFRGSSMPIGLLKTANKNLSEGKQPSTWDELGFFSTSIRPSVAHMFLGDLKASVPYEGKVKALMIVHIKGAKPVSALHAFHSQEEEMLLPPGAEFAIKRVLFDNPAQPQHAIVFLEQK